MLPPAKPSLLKARDRLIVALDVPTTAAAQALVLQIGEAAGFYKVGLQLFTAAGPDLVRELKSSGKKVFLDLKFHDIPNTVAMAVSSVSALGVDMLTLHAGGGLKMLRAAVEAASGPDSPVLLAVTVLTSLSGADLAEVGLSGADPVRDQVMRLAVLAKSAGCGGLVTSPNEVREVRQSVGDGMLIVTPGIRPSESKADDQARTSTAAEAIRAGATHLVVGRPISSAPDPAAAARALVTEIAEA